MDAIDTAAQGRALGDRGVLRFITAGSVDDGKSTLIGRLLHDSHAILEDQFSALSRASQRRGAEDADLSLLTDGLEAEREQGITIDVAYRYFATPRRKFIIADTPGHEQYTRNMVTGASTAGAAVILLDARKGVLPQSRRHLLLAHLIGIDDVIVAVNKMDAVGYAQPVFHELAAAFTEYAAPLKIARLSVVPLSALRGDMVALRGDNLGWYQGPTLLELLERVAPAGAGGAVDQPLRFPVQWVNRAGETRGYAGKVAAGRVTVGDEVAVLPSGRTTRVRAIAAPDGPRSVAWAGESVTLSLADPLDIARGDMLSDAARRPHASSAPGTLSATLCWLAAEPLARNARYLLRHTTRTVKAAVQSLNHQLDIHTLARRAPQDTLHMNDIAGVTLALQQPVFADAYRDSQATGAFILIDEVTHQTVAAGMVAPPVSLA